MAAIPVNVTIAASDNGGYAIWVRSIAVPSQVWWKWYEQEGYAYDEAVTLGMATQQPQSMERITVTLRTALKSEASVDPDKLTRFGFKLRS